jgi:acetyl esterase/lipase
VPSWLDARLLRHRQGRHRGLREPCEASHRSYRQKSETRRNQPESGACPPPRPDRPTREDTESQQIEYGGQHGERGHAPEALQQGARLWPRHGVDHAPCLEKPEGLGQGRERQDAHEKNAKRFGSSHAGAPRADHRLFYGPDPAQFGDLYPPPQPDPHPALILLHGGGWRAQYGLAPLGQLCTALTNEGLAVWNMEFRRLGNGGGWPITFADVATGADFLRGIADHYALDLSSVMAMGHSSGGHLALWLAGRHRLPAESPLCVAAALPLHGVVSLAGIPDLVERVKRNLGSGPSRGACQELLGGSPEDVPQRYQQASPRALLPLGVPQWHIVGRYDQSVPVDYVQQYVAVATQHDEVHWAILPDAGHFELVVPTTSAWGTVRHAVHALLARR